MFVIDYYNDKTRGCIVHYADFSLSTQLAAVAVINTSCIFLSMFQ